MYYNTNSRQVLFKYQTGRAAEWPKETLKNYQGYLQTDGYAAYNQFDDVEGIMALNCWVHARRKFIDAQNFDNAKASEVLTQIQLLYAVEKHCVENKYAVEEIKNYRLQNAVPVLQNTARDTANTVNQQLAKKPDRHGIAIRSPAGINSAYTFKMETCVLIIT